MSSKINVGFVKSMRLKLRIICLKDLPKNIGVVLVFCEIGLKQNNFRAQLKSNEGWHCSSQSILSGFIICSA